MEQELYMQVNGYGKCRYGWGKEAAVIEYFRNIGTKGADQCRREEAYEGYHYHADKVTYIRRCREKRLR